MRVSLNKNTIEISSQSEDYKNIVVRHDMFPGSESNQYGVFYLHPKTGELHDYNIRVDNQKMLRTISGVDCRRYDKPNKKFIDGSNKGEWSTTYVIFEDANKPTAEEKQLYKFLGKLDVHVRTEFSKALKEEGIDMTKKIARNIIPHEEMVFEKTQGILKEVDPAKEKALEKKLSPMFTVKHPFYYGEDKEHVKTLKQPEDKIPFKKLMPWKFVDARFNTQYTSEQLEQLSPEWLFKNKKALYQAVLFAPRRITSRDGNYFVKSMSAPSLCHIRKARSGNMENVKEKFKNIILEDDDEEESVETPRQNEEVNEEDF